MTESSKPDAPEPTVTSAARFFRVIACVYELHAEVAEISLDDAARRRLAEELRFLRETLRETVSRQAYAELERLDSAPVPELSQDELRIACSELLGWLIALLPEAERAATGGHTAEDAAAGRGAEGERAPPAEGTTGPEEEQGRETENA